MCCGVGRGVGEATALALSSLSLLLALLGWTLVGKGLAAFEGKSNAKDESKEANTKTVVCFPVELAKWWISRMKHRLSGLTVDWEANERVREGSWASQ